MSRGTHSACKVTGLLLLAALATAARAQVDPHAAHALGRVDFPVSCSAPAQVQFNHAVALLHHMTYPQARRQPEAALLAYQRSMALYPGRFNSLLGAARAASAVRNEAAARDYYQQLLRIAAGGTRGPELAEARRFVAARRPR